MQTQQQAVRIESSKNEQTNVATSPIRARSAKMPFATVTRLKTLESHSATLSSLSREEAVRQAIQRTG